MPQLESAIKEALRLHPPLILVLRVAKEELEIEGFRIAPGKLVGASLAVSNRIPEDFPDADAFVPERYLEPRSEDRANPWTWIPFGAGRHRCVGAPFAMMQLKAIFSVLLRGWEFELAQPSETYRNDHSKMVVQLQQPCAVHYRRRAAPDRSGPRREDRRRPRPVPGPRGVRVGGTGRVLGVEEGRAHRHRRDPGRGLRPMVEQAVAFCPTKALRIEED